jgi:hypothetical protein
MQWQLLCTLFRALDCTVVDRHGSVTPSLVQASIGQSYRTYSIITRQVPDTFVTRPTVCDSFDVAGRHDRFVQAEAPFFVQGLGRVQVARRLDLADRGRHANFVAEIKLGPAKIAIVVSVLDNRSSRCRGRGRMC